MCASKLPYNCSILRPGKLVFIMQNSSQPLRMIHAFLSDYSLPTLSLWGGSSKDVDK